ncbi:WD40 repeat domain-containing protein [Candidatus Thorarchaeota archaeon]|nr:MAG: WD40 repeat domain-containing protein [Candidatus Thorarchaeota archaeon]
MPTNLLFRPSGSAASPLTEISVSPKSKRIACGTLDARVLILDAKSGKPRKAFNGHEQVISAVRFSKSGDSVFSGSWDGTTRMWRTSRRPAENHEMKHNTAVKSLAVAPGGRKGAAGSRDGQIKVFSTKSLKCIRNLSAHTRDVSGLGFARNGKHLVSVGWDGSCYLWDMKEYSLINEILHTKERMRCLAIGPDINRIFIGLHSGTIKSLSLDEPNRVTDLNAHSDVVTSLSLLPSGTHLVSGGWDRRVNVWNLVTGEVVDSIRLETGVCAVGTCMKPPSVFMSDYSGSLISWHPESIQSL